MAIVFVLSDLNIYLGNQTVYNFLMHLVDLLIGEGLVKRAITHSDGNTFLSGRDLVAGIKIEYFDTSDFVTLENSNKVHNCR